MFRPGRRMKTVDIVNAESTRYPMSRYVIGPLVKKSRSAERCARRPRRRTGPARRSSSTGQCAAAAPRVRPRRRTTVDGHTFRGRPDRRLQRLRGTGGRRRRSTAPRGRPLNPSFASADRRAVHRRARCSANVVVLAHGHGSLHVLVIQRTRTSVELPRGRPSATRRDGRDSSAAVSVKYNYKLPGGQLVLLNDEQNDYEREDRNTCCCLDDQRWYAAALGHLNRIIHLPFSVGTSSSESSSRTDVGGGGDCAPLRFVSLGKWYRTRGKNDWLEECTSADKRGHPPAPHYPYKPPHVSRQAAEQKRVYAVPDAVGLFRDQQQPFRLQLARAKMRTVAGPGGASTTTTAYKCKFVPLARLHENNRVYGPILSSLPVVLSSMNLIYVP